MINEQEDDSPTRKESEIAALKKRKSELLKNFRANKKLGLSEAAWSEVKEKAVKEHTDITMSLIELGEDLG